MSCSLSLAGPLTDGVVMVRLPSAEAGDLEAVRGYIDDRQLDGCWFPRLPHVPTEQVVQGWLDAWAGLPSRDGPMAVVTVAQEPRLIGIAMARIPFAIRCGPGAIGRAPSSPSSAQRRPPRLSLVNCERRNRPPKQDSTSATHALVSAPSRSHWVMSLEYGRAISAVLLGSGTGARAVHSRQICARVSPSAISPPPVTGLASCAAAGPDAHRCPPGRPGESSRRTRRQARRAHGCGTGERTVVRYTGWTW